MIRTRRMCSAAGVAALLWSTSAVANTTRLGGGGGGLDLSLTRIVLSLLLCLGIAISVIVVLKRKGGSVNAGSALRGLLAKSLPVNARIQVIESRRVSVNADLCLVRCDDVEYLVLCSAKQQQLLREQPVARETDA